MPASRSVRRLSRLLAGLWLAMLGLPALAQSSAQLPHTKVELVSETLMPAPGRAFTVAVVMTPQPGWHTYWKNPGDSGMETRAEWSLPPGASAGAFRYPVPQTYMISGIMNHVYGAKNALLAEVRLPPGLDGALPVRLKLDWLVCNEELCVPESATLALTLVAGNGAADPPAARTFAEARAALPRRIAGARFQVASERFRLAAPVPAEGVTGAHFFALDEGVVNYAAPQALRRDGELLIVETALAPGGKPAAAAGVLRIERGDEVIGLEVAATPGAVPTGEPARTNVAGDAPSFALVFALAVAGGLLLNVMPCVFPILSLKALSLARSGGGEAAARTEALAYTGGVVLVCAALGGLAIAVAQAGGGAGWAAQLQDPRVILLLMLLTLAIGLNFAGLFEVNVSAGGGQALAEKQGAAGAFFTGALAAFVATPCTGPFMAGALGAALVLPPALGLAVFAGLGLGLALPFLAVGFVPALRRRLPKPGAWMITFRRALAVPMLLTALALAWVLGRQAGVDGLMLGLAAALLLALGLWWAGLRQARMARAWLPAAVAVAAMVAGPVALARVAASPVPSTAMAGGPLAAQAFSPARLAELRAAGKPVFLYFTADWCLTCKVNERGAMARPAVAEAFRAGGVQVLAGDWTRPDAAIARFLEERGRAGIPLYLFYHPDGRIEELPQILTVERMVQTAKGTKA